MPCTQGAASDILHSPQPYQADDHLRSRNRELEGMLCALISEIESELGVFDASHILVQASVNGNAPLAAFWSNHQSEDKQRLGDWINRLSPDELKCLEVLHKMRHVGEIEGSKGIEVISKFFALSNHERDLIAQILNERQLS